MTAQRGRPPTGKAKALTGIRLTSPCRQWYAQHFGNRYGSIAYVVESWPHVYEATLADIRANGVLSHSDAALLQSAMTGVRLDAALAGLMLPSCVEGVPGVDPDLIAQLQLLPRAVRAALELWATTPGIDAGRLEEHLAMVSKK
jgi:hypothetical protein